MERVNYGLRVPGWSRRLASFLFYFDDGHWAWSEQVEWMHGHRLGEASERLTLPQIHPDDGADVAERLHGSGRSHQPFSSRHRIVDGDERTRDVLMVGAPFYDLHGASVGIEGYCFDMAPEVGAARAVSAQDSQLATQLRVTAENGPTDGQRHRLRADTRC